MVNNSPFWSTEDALAAGRLARDQGSIQNEQPSPFMSNLMGALAKTGQDAWDMTPFKASQDVGEAIVEQDPIKGALGALGLIPGAAGNAAAKGGRYALTKGIPETFKLPDGSVNQSAPIPGIIDAAHDYARKTGLRMEQPREFSKLDKDRAKDIAQAFDRGKHDPSDPAVQKSADALTRETRQQYDALADRGYQFQFMKQDADGNITDPYSASPALGYKDLADNKRLEIFPTETGGFGSSSADVSTNPMLGRTDIMWGDQPTTHNDLFRAVHDAHGHFGAGNPFFRAPGEERAWQIHAGMFSPDARKLMTTETRGQNSWVNYGPHGDANRSASGADTVFADQKTMNMPDWVQYRGRDNIIFDQPPFVPTGVINNEEE